MTVQYAALLPFGKVVTLLSELLPIGGVQNTGTVRNRTLRMGQDVVQQHLSETAKQPVMQAGDPVAVGFGGGYVRSRHRQEERHFTVVAGEVMDTHGCQHRFAFARNGQATAFEAFWQALTTAGVHVDTPATVLCDGDAGLCLLQCEALPDAKGVLDRWHPAVRFEHALQARPRPRRKPGRYAPCGHGGLRPKAREVPLVAWALGRVPAQARRPVPLDGAATRYVTWPASAAFSSMQASSWATSHARKTCCYTLLPGVGVASQSRLRSWNARSIRSSPSA